MSWTDGVEYCQWLITLVMLWSSTRIKWYLRTFGLRFRFPFSAWGFIYLPNSRTTDTLTDSGRWIPPALYQSINILLATASSTYWTREVCELSRLTRNPSLSTTTGSFELQASEERPNWVHRGLLTNKPFFIAQGLSNEPLWRTQRC